MKKNIHLWYPVGLVALLLAILLSSNPLWQTHTNAQVVQPNQIHASTQVTHDQDLTNSGKVIIVSLSQQHLYAYQNGEEVFDTAVITGQPALPTPLGTYHIFKKLSPTIFHSSYPRSSRYWYPPTHISYALEFRAPGYFLHDSWWHSVYGPGNNSEHYDPQYGWQEGSHGCVSMALDAARWLYSWAPIGTTVRIIH